MIESYNIPVWKNPQELLNPTPDSMVFKNYQETKPYV